MHIALLNYYKAQATQEVFGKLGKYRDRFRRFILLGQDNALQETHLCIFWFLCQHSVDFSRLHSIVLPL